jgi:putative ATPase
VHVPLAERIRPQSVDEVVGQQHLLGEGRPIQVALRAGRPHSMILWGPPGVGKTTLARLMAKAFDAEFIAISAVLAGVKEIREAVERAKLARDQYGRATIVFVDEVHRFNKAQQDAFLPHVESGLFTFIGATTENPSFEVIGALLSRAQVYVLESLKPEDLDTLIARGFEAEKMDSTTEARARIAEFADGDGRRALNLAEQVSQAAAVEGRRGVDVDFVNGVAQRAGRRFDKGGENFYDQISALHKSVRGSDPDAALYWLARMLDGGVDPRYLARRMIRMASEDVGLADPRALEVAISATEVYERLGTPEGELALAECVIYLAVAAKSNAVYVAYGAARAFVAQDGTRPVPLHIRNAPTKLMKNLGYGKDYRYAHDEDDAYAAGES